MLESMLKGLHYQVTVAENGEKALQLIEKQEVRPDLIITDVVMPGIGGKAMVDQIRKTLPDQKVLFMSGYTNDTMIQHGIQESGIDFIPKPFTLHDIAAKIRETLHHKNDSSEDN